MVDLIHEKKLQVHHNEFDPFMIVESLFDCISMN